MKKLLTFTSLIILASCTSGSDGKPLAKTTFAHLKQLYLDVNEVNTIDDSFSNASAPTPDHFYVPVRGMFKNYVDTRFHAVGSGNYKLDIELEQYDVAYKQKDSENSMANFVGVARMDEYIVDMHVNLTLSDPTTGELKGRRLKVRRIMNIVEHVSIAEREQHQKEGVEKMFAELDSAIIDVLRNDFRISF